jgi:hypothetical protein
VDVAQAVQRVGGEWAVCNPRPEIIFPAAYGVAVGDRDDPRFAAAVLATVAQSLNYARVASGQAERHAGEVAEKARWRAQCLPGTSRPAFRRQKRAERDAAAEVGRPCRSFDTVVLVRPTVGPWPMSRYRPSNSARGRDETAAGAGEESVWAPGGDGRGEIRGCR